MHGILQRPIKCYGISVMRESRIEKKVGDYAKANGWLVFKFTGRKGVPDRIFIKDGKIFFVEFKAPGKLPTELQKRIHDKIREQGGTVFVIDNIEEGYKIVDSQ